MLVPEFCSTNTDFPEEFYDSLPKYCEDCEFPMEISEALTHLHCSNPKCPAKVAKRLVAIANKLGVKDLGDSRASKFIETWGIDNPLSIFQYEPDVDGAMASDISLDVSKKISEQFQARKKFTLAEYVKIAQLPHVQESASLIFGDFDDLDEAYKAIEEGGVTYIGNKLSIKKMEDDEISIRAVKVYESLMTYKSDLLDCIGSVEIIKTNSDGGLKFTAVCSDEVGAPFRTKADFYATVNNKYPNVHVEFKGAVTKAIDFLIWAGADGSPAKYTNKVKKAEGYNQKYQENLANGKLKEGEHEIVIMTANQFLAFLEKRIEGRD